MTNVFNLSNIFAESTAYNVLANPVISQKYLYNAMNDLEEFNHAYTESTTSLYKAILEADNREDENAIFCQYFSEIDKHIRNTINKINETTSRFIINVENIVDANKDILSNDNVINNVKPFTYHFTKYQKINDSSFPSMNIIGIFKQEFDYIGQLLQDLGPAASNQSKLKVIATVYNTMNSTKPDITRKCIEDIVGTCDDTDCMTKFPEMLYKFLKADAADVEITKGHLYEVKMSLNNYKSISDACVATADSLIEQLKSISNEIRNIICGNEKNKLKIDTPTDGIRNTEYKLDTYGMNQVDLFLKTKINQVIQMTNIYYIALAIKLDATMDYFKQCKDILQKAEMSCDSDVESKATKNTQDDIDDNGEVDGSNTSDTDDDIQIDDDSESNPDDSDKSKSDLDDDYTIDTNKDGDSSNDDGEPDNETSKSDGGSKDAINDLDEALKEFDESCDIFNYGMFCLGIFNENMRMIDNVINIVNEADGDNKPEPTDGNTPNNTTDSNKDTKDDLKATLDKAGVKDSVFAKIMEMIRKLLNKFLSFFTQTIEKKIKKLDANKKYIQMDSVDHVNESGNAVLRETKPAILDSLTIPRFDINSLKNINSEEDFIKQLSLPSEVRTLYEKDTSKGLKNAIVDTVYNPDEKVGIKNAKDVKMIDLYNWCIKYPKIKEDIEEMSKILESGYKNAEKIAKSLNEAESIFDNDDWFFFNEAIGKGSSDENKNSEEKEKKINDDSKKIEMYFKICGHVMTGKMTAAQRVFNEYYNVLIWHIEKKSDGKSKDADEKESTSESVFFN